MMPVNHPPKPRVRYLPLQTKIKRLLYFLSAIVPFVVYYRFIRSGSQPLDYSTPFCSANGICGESPTSPTPRTIYSARSREQYETWMQLFQQQNDTAAKLSSQPKLVFWGDSITEAWLGTSYGHPAPLAKGIPQVFQEVFGDYEPRLVLAISGDQTQHLLWRIEHTDLQYWDGIHVVLIGTNNLGSGELPGPTAEGIVEVVRTLLDKSPNNQVVLLEVLPRGDGETTLAKLCPPRCQKTTGGPFTSFFPAIDKVNAAVKQKLEGKERVSILACKRDFMHEGNIHPELFADRLHPNEAGQRILGQCIRKAVDNILTRDQPAE